VSAGTNLWLEADLASSRLSPPSPLGERPGEVDQFLSLVTRLSSLPFNLSLTGDGANVVTRARLNFNEPFSTPLQNGGADGFAA